MVRFAVVVIEMIVLAYRGRAVWFVFLERVGHSSTSQRRIYSEMCDVNVRLMCA